jgi:hypothetical protein
MVTLKRLFQNKSPVRVNKCALHLCEVLPIQNKAKKMGNLDLILYSSHKSFMRKIGLRLRSAKISRWLSEVEASLKSFRIAILPILAGVYSNSLVTKPYKTNKIKSIVGI